MANLCVYDALIRVAFSKLVKTDCTDFPDPEYTQLVFFSKNLREFAEIYSALRDCVLKLNDDCGTNEQDTQLFTTDWRLG